MTTPEPIRRFVEATNAGDTEAFLDTFTADASLTDWGRSFQGREQIARWNQSDNIGVKSNLRIVRIAAVDGTLSRPHRRQGQWLQRRGGHDLHAGRRPHSELGDHLTVRTVTVRAEVSRGSFLQASRHQPRYARPGESTTRKRADCSAMTKEMSTFCAAAAMMATLSMPPGLVAR